MCIGKNPGKTRHKFLFALFLWSHMSSAEFSQQRCLTMYETLPTRESNPACCLQPPRVKKLQCCPKPDTNIVIHHKSHGQRKLSGMAYNLSHKKTLFSGRIFQGLRSYLPVISQDKSFLWNVRGQPAELTLYYLRLLPFYVGTLKSMFHLDHQLES